MAVKFLYFDLGNVLLLFDHHKATRQMAEVAGVPEKTVWSAIFETDLNRRYELGNVTSRDFYEEFCEKTGTRADYDALALAGSAMFEVNLSARAVLAAVVAAGFRVGLLSNTNEMHWNYFTDGRYGMIPGAFEVCVLSYQVHAMKPGPAIYLKAAEMAGVEPQEIFYVDDIAGHVEGARAVGFDAVQYTTTAKLVDDLHERGVRFNY